MNCRIASRVARRAPLVAAVLALACSAAGVGTGASAPSGPSPIARPGGTGWKVNTIEHVDLWLHGFALLTGDTANVPLFARGYRERMTALKRQRNIFTQLDANQQQLSARFASNPSLTNAQFVAMYFPSWQEIVNATDAFIRSQGNPRAASDPQLQQEIALLAANFPTPADRDWLRLFVQSLQDENNKLYDAYWKNEQAARGAGFAAFQQRWTSTWYPKLERYLNNTQQQVGEIALSLPLGGEGRTINDGKQSNLIAVDYPSTADSAANALFTFAHEAIGRIVQEAITDNTTPAQQRSGETAAYQTNGAVRGGLLLVQRLLPDLAAGYMRYYLHAAGRTPPAGDPTSAFVAEFPVPQTIVDAVKRQIEIVLGGI